MAGGAEDAPAAALGGGGASSGGKLTLRVSEETLQDMLSIEAQMERHPVVKAKLEELFFKWLSFDETDELIRSAVREVAAGGSVLGPGVLSASASSPRNAKSHPPHVPSLALNGQPPSSPTSSTFPPGPSFAQGLTFGHGSSPPKSPTRLSRDAYAHGGDSDHGAVNPHKSAISLALARSPKRKIDHQVSSATAFADMYSPNKRREKVSDPGGTPRLPGAKPTGAVRPSSAPDHAPRPGGRMRQRSELPRFFVPGEGGRGRGRKLLDDSLNLKMDAIRSMFHAQEASGGLTVHDFVHVTKVLCKFPSFFNVPLFERILSERPPWEVRGGDEKDSRKAPRDPARIPLDVFLRFWSAEIEPFDLIDRFFRLVKQPGREYIAREDFLPYMRELLRFHPGLEFLENSEFQEKYAITVIARIFYTVNTSRTGRITARELRKSNLVQAFLTVDEQEDINVVLDYFSYEHFYVLYCRFWELDADRDMKVSEEDLLKYNDHSLSAPIVQRIFEVGDRPFPFQGPGDDGDGAARPASRAMTYEDFIYFMLSEEDRGSEASLRYWFRCCDLDEDGRLTPGDMRFFYQVQAHRMDCLGHEPICFEDVLCQLTDMIKPAGSGVVVLDDLVRPDVMHISGALFDVLFNLNKFFTFEQRDPFSERAKREDNFECEWDRFAFYDYNRLAAEEDAEAADGDLMEVADADRFGWITADAESGDLDSIGSSL